MSNSSSTALFPVASILGVVFVTLKLTGHIDWSWWWVTLPFWGGAVLAVVLLAVVAAIALVVTREASGPIRRKSRR